MHMKQPDLRDILRAGMNRQLVASTIEEVSEHESKITKEKVTDDQETADLKQALSYNRRLSDMIAKLSIEKPINDEM